MSAAENLGRLSGAVSETSMLKKICDPAMIGNRTPNLLCKLWKEINK